MHFRQRRTRSPAHARVDRLDYALAFISGVLLALSFPKYGQPAFAWIALVPLLLAFTGWTGRPGRLRGIPPLRALQLSLIAGMVFFLGTVYWTGTVIVTFGDVPVAVAAIGVVLMSAYLALYHVVGLLVTSRVIARFGAIGLFFAPIGWVGGEFLRGFMLGGFPWVPLGNSQVHGAAGGAARQRARRLWAVAARGVHQRDACLRAASSGRGRAIAVSAAVARAAGDWRVGHLAHP